MSFTEDRPDESTLDRAIRHRAVNSGKYAARTTDELRNELYRADLLLTRQASELQSLRQEQRQEAQRRAQAEANRDAQKALYERQTARTEKFKSAYETLKASPHVRLAKIVVAPVRRTRRLLRGAYGEGGAQRPEQHIGEASSSAMPSGAVPENASITERIRWAKHLYLREGKISEPAKLLGGLDTDSVGTEASFTRQVVGAARLLRELPSLPPRQPTIGYQAQRGKILYCAHSTGEFNSNGYATRTAGLTQAMAEQDDVVVMARPGYPWDAKTEESAPSESRFERDINGLRHIFSPGPSLVQDPLDLYFQYAADIIGREAVIQRASLIHAASNHVTALPALMAARRLGVPFVYEVRGFWEITEASRNSEWGSSERHHLAVELETMVATGADKVLAITGQVRDELIRRGVEPGRITLLPNAADPYEFAPLPAGREILGRIQTSKTSTVIGYAGSVLDYEGPQLLVEAFSRAVQIRPELVLLVVGDGPALAAMKQRAAELLPANSVVFAGRAPSSEIPRYLSAMDIVVCPRLSNQITEMVSPLKPLEAMAAGRPVVASDVAPLVDIFGHDADRGLIFPAGDTDAMARALVELADNPERRADIGRAARSWVVEHRSWSAMAEEVRRAHRTLDHDMCAPDVGAKELSKTRLALISDEFTRSSLASECQLVLPAPGTWRQQLESQNIDALLVESAWEGNDGLWRGKVGYYDESSFAELKAMVTYCRSRGIPTIFWNKEDPIHFSRFRLTAKLFDHVFTTDADRIPSYYEHRGASNSSIGSLPFWAQPSLHNPMHTERRVEHSIAYGGTFYGERYPERSRVLSTLLSAGQPYGLAIYDRQANLPESPYHFPAELADFVRGGLDYMEMVQAYKTHPVHLNVNSVTDSPTMFSRRVVELAASGTPVLSGPGNGVDTVFNGMVPTTADATEAGLIAQLWMENEPERNADAWNVHRYTYRAHLASHRLAYMLRTAGLLVKTPQLVPYTLIVDDLESPTTALILEQTHRPDAVGVVSAEDNRSQEVARQLTDNGIAVLWGEAGGKVPGLSCRLGAALSDVVAAEDLCRAAEFTSGRVQLSRDDVTSVGKTLWVHGERVSGAPCLGGEERGEDSAPVLTLRRNFSTTPSVTAPSRERIEVLHESRRVLVAGHDLKFAGGIMDWMQQQGHHVTTDVWDGHAVHDAERSKRLLADADTIFCEWSLGNVEWYARYRTAGQRLTSRFHSQELFTPYLHRLDVGLIDHTVFVGEFVRQVALRRFGYDIERTSVVPNTLGIEPAGAAGQPERRHTLGIVGMVPRQKHLDRALTLIARLRENDRRFTLRVKGRRPEEYPWMLGRAGEMGYYNELQRRISDDSRLRGAVHFDPHGDDMADWYAGIGVALSTSDFESFHLTLADGAASGAMPVSLAWPGAGLIYPKSWLHLNVESMLLEIRDSAEDPQRYSAKCDAAKAFAVEHFSPVEIHQRLGDLILGASQ
ncbi:glycosyltransferase [Arthrobacter sp. 179]|uniref:glycosyltransferase n=1 Tax=Arthrobacter sp. 179 TaxID=3457734 RepID=UPI0040345927